MVRPPLFAPVSITFCRFHCSADENIGCGIHAIADALPGVPMSAIKVVIRILLHGDWVYDALGASDAVVADVSAGVQWMCVLCANATFFMRV